MTASLSGILRCLKNSPTVIVTMMNPSPLLSRHAAPAAAADAGGTRITGNDAAVRCASRLGATVAPINGRHGPVEVLVPQPLPVANVPHEVVQAVLQRCLNRVSVPADPVGIAVRRPDCHVG